MKALSVLSIDRLLEAACELANRITMAAGHKIGAGYSQDRWRFAWAPHIMQYVERVMGDAVSIAGIEEAAATAYAERATEIVQLAMAYDATARLRREFATVNWEKDYPAYDEYTGSADIVQQAKMVRIDAALSDLMWWASRCNDLRADWRAIKSAEAAKATSG